MAHSILLTIPASMAILSFVFVGCSSESTTASGTDAATSPQDGGATAESGSDTSTGTDSGSGSDTSTPVDSGGKCNAVVNGASVVGEVAGVGAKPAPAGGTIVDGTYFLTKHEVFAPSAPDANTRKRTIVFTGNKFETHENDTGQTEKQISGTYAVNGTNVVFSITCPITASATVPFTATPTSYVTFSQSDDVFSGTKQ